GGARASSLSTREWSPSSSKPGGDCCCCVPAGGGVDSPMVGAAVLDEAPESPITSTSPADDALLAPALLPSPLWSSLTRGRFDDGWACGFRESILANPSA
ncbi:unnamed protein product, partial [Ectocarpus sp. 6 AP-2014]